MKNILISVKGFIILFLILLLQIETKAQTHVTESNVYGTWDVAGSPYIVHCDINIHTDSSLVIEPGVVVEFASNYQLLVNGRLVSIGTETDSISFTVDDTTGYYNHTFMGLGEG